MTANGLDSNEILTGHAARIKQAGYSWVARYINTNKPTHLTRPEAQALASAGLYVVSIWEKGFPTSLGYFTSSAGVSDGRGAVTQAQALGQPVGTPIYFAVDYDASQSDLSQITAYFVSAHEVVRAAGYFVGVYGSGVVCQCISQAGYASFTWLAQSTGWGGYSGWKPRASIVQGPGATVLGMSVDTDQSNGSAGGWMATV